MHVVVIGLYVRLFWYHMWWVGVFVVTVMREMLLVVDVRVYAERVQG